MKIKEGFKLRTVGGEYIVTGEGLAQIDFNKLISLNKSAVYLWKEIEGKVFDVQKLVGLLTKKYAIATDIALADASDIIEDWVNAGIIEE